MKGYCKKFRNKFGADVNSKIERFAKRSWQKKKINNKRKKMR